MVTIADGNPEILAAALRSVPIALALIDRDLRYVEVNAACALMTGRPLGEHAGHTLREINPLLSPEMEALIRHVLTTGRPALDVRLSRPTPHAPGGVLQIIMNITPYRDAAGTIIGVASTATDVSDWVALRDRVARVESLETSVKVAAEMAHDYNNLLTVISARCDLALLELPEESAARAEVELIRSAVIGASKIARRLSGAAGDGGVMAGPVDLADVLRDGQRLLHAEVQGPNTISVIPCHDVATVIGERTQIEQMLLELVRNARESLDRPGGITVRAFPRSLADSLMTLSGELSAGEYVELSVSDTGHGIAPEVLGHIFEPYYSTRHGVGRGLGLANLFAVVRAMKGGIEVESAPRRGTQVRVLLPRVAAPLGEVPRRKTRGGRILLVSPDDTLRAQVRNTLMRNGFDVLEARQGAEALLLASELPQIDLLISDSVLVLMDGADLAVRLAQRGVEVPVLFLGTPTPHAESGATPASPARHRTLAKPFASQTLLTAVFETLVLTPK